MLTWHKEGVQRANRARAPAGWATPEMPGPILDSSRSLSCMRNTGQPTLWPRGWQETPNNLKLRTVMHCRKNKWEMSSAHRRKRKPGSHSQAWGPGSHHPCGPNHSMRPFSAKCFWTVRAPRPSADTNFLWRSATWSQDTNIVARISICFLSKNTKPAQGVGGKKQQRTEQSKGLTKDFQHWSYHTRDIVIWLHK